MRRPKLIANIFPKLEVSGEAKEERPPLGTKLANINFFAIFAWILYRLVFVLSAGVRFPRP